MITGFNHTSFAVENLDRALEFWTKGLGFQAARVGERSGDWQALVTGVPGAAIKVAHLFGYGHHMELIQYLHPHVAASSPAPNLPGVGHICLEVRDIQGTLDRLLSLGGKTQGEVATVTDGVMKGSRALYMRDPDGIIVELVEIANEAK